MAVATITYADVKQYIRDWNNATSSAEDLRMQLRIIEDAMDDVLNSYDWPWIKSTRQVTTIGGRRFTLASDLDNGDTTVTATGTPFTSNELVNRWLVADSNQGIPFMVKSNTTSVITLAQQYSGSTIAAGQQCVVYCPSYALPDYFGTLQTFTMLGVGLKPRKFTQDEMEAYRGRPYSQGLAQGWFVGALSVDGLPGYDAPRLWLFPNPLGPAVGADDDDDTPQVFQLAFRRKWGWFDATTNAWKASPTADTDILDFPVNQRGMLRAVIKYALIKETGEGNLAQAEQDMARKIGLAIGRCEEDATPFQVRTQYPDDDPDRWVNTLNWLGTLVIRES